MNFLAIVTNFVIAHETAVFLTIILALVVFQLAVVVPALINNEPNTTDESDRVNDDSQETPRTHYYTHHSLFKF